MPLIKVAKISDLETSSCMTVQANGKDVALYNVDGHFYATTNTCPHRGGPLGEGMLEGPVVTCPWHGWQFDVCQGTSPVNPDLKIPSFPVKVEGEDVWVEIP